MPDLIELQKRLENLNREYRGVRSMIEMMEKGTPREELQKMRVEKLNPVEEEIKRLEVELANGYMLRGGGRLYQDRRGVIPFSCLG
jgi:hypothetical protein